MRFLIPEGGVSAIDAPGQPFHDPAADRALFDAHRAATSAPAPTASCVRLPLHINDQAFAEALVAAFERDRRRAGAARRAIAEQDRHAPHRPHRPSSSSFRAMIAARRADHRRRRRHRPVGQVRGGRRHRPDRDLQLRPLPHGRARLARRPARLRQRQRDRRARWRTRCCRWCRHTPVLAGVNGTDPFMIRDEFLRRLAGARLLRRPELPDASASSTASSAPTSRRPAWATGSRSR